MVKTIGMQFIQYMNFFERIIGLRTRHCFLYNECIIFVVPHNLVARAIGIGGSNIKKLAIRLRRRVKIIASPSGIEDAEKFIASIVFPVRFKSLRIENDEMIINASTQSRAMLIGRNKTRLEDLQRIVKEYFNIKKVRLV